MDYWFGYITGMVVTALLLLFVIYIDWGKMEKGKKPKERKNCSWQ